METNSFLTHHEFVLLFLYFFFSEETSVGRDVDPDTHFLTFNAIYNTLTHRNNVRFTIPNRRRQGRLPSCRQEATAIHRRQREDGSRQRYASAEKFCF